MIPSTPLRSLLGSALLLGSVSLAQADVILKGTIRGRTIDDNVVIASNTTCVLEGTRIRGNVMVMQGAKLIAYAAKIEGNVQAFDAKKVDLRSFCRIEGDVQGEGTGTLQVRDGTRVDGNVQLKEGLADTKKPALLVTKALVKGDVQAEKSFGRLQATKNIIGGNLQFVENQGDSYVIEKNAIEGDLQFFKNSGPGTITLNGVGGNLQSKENSPRPEVSNNLVDGDTEVE